MRRQPKESLGSHFNDERRQPSSDNWRDSEPHPELISTAASLLLTGGGGVICYTCSPDGTYVCPPNSAMPSSVIPSSDSCPHERRDVDKGRGSLAAVSDGLAIKPVPERPGAKELGCGQARLALAP